MGSAVSNPVGFQVVTVLPDSPAAAAGLEYFFDFVLEIDEVSPTDLPDLVRKLSEDRKCKFLVFSTRTGMCREISLVPQRWSGQGLIGAEFRRAEISDCLQWGLRVVGVAKGSPADAAGLNPKSDFLLGVSGGVFESLSDFEDFAECSQNAQEIFVHNTDTNTTRSVLIKPNANGVVGCDLAVGALHGLPVKVNCSACPGGACGSTSPPSGIRIARVFPGGPLDKANLEIVSDFIVAIDGRRLLNMSDFTTAVKSFEGKPVKIEVRNFRTSSSREILVTPRRWQGQGLIGAAVQWEIFPDVGSYGLRVVDVLPGSPADLAGLSQGRDFILACDDIALANLDDFGAIASAAAAEDRQVTMAVFNGEDLTTRLVQLKPHYGWGGEGAVGCDLATGALHSLPSIGKRMSEISSAKVFGNALEVNATVRN